MASRLLGKKFNLAKAERQTLGVEADDLELRAPDVGRHLGETVFLRQDVEVVDKVVADVPVARQGAAPTNGKSDLAAAVRESYLRVLDGPASNGFR